MMDRERLQKLRGEHRPWREGASICVRSGCQGWPCEQSQILDLALEAERLRQDLVKYRRDFQLEQKRGDDLKGEAERLRADWGAALDTMSFLRDDLTKARTEAAWLRTNMNAIDALKASKNYPDDILEAVWLISDSALAGSEATIEREEDWEDGFDE